MKFTRGDIALYWNNLFICSIHFMVSFKKKWVAENVFIHSLWTPMQSRTLRNSNYRAEALVQFMFSPVLTSQAS